MTRPCQNNSHMPDNATNTTNCSCEPTGQGGGRNDKTPTMTTGRPGPDDDDDDYREEDNQEKEDGDDDEHDDDNNDGTT